MIYSGNKISSSSPFESSSKKKRKDIDRFIPHSVSKNLYNLFSDTVNPNKIASGSQSSQKKKGYSIILEENLLTNHRDCGKVLNFTEDCNS